MSETDQLLSLPHLPRRVAAAREGARLTQAQLSQKLGFKDRQTLAAIESDQRRVSVPELMAIMKATGRDMEFFTDPFRIVGEGGFSYRASGTSDIEVEQFEEQAGKWLALWRYLGEKRGDAPSVLRPRLAINERSTFEEAQKAGEQVAAELKLGKVPANKLAEAVELKFKILVLYAEMPKGVSGAAVQLTSGDSILINRNEPPWRQTFDLAHELFHVLTWDAMPPERVDRENPTSYKAKRIEQLADNFAGALLMPSQELKRQWAAKPETQSLKAWLAETSGTFRVSVQALYWRLVALGLLAKEAVDVSKVKTTVNESAKSPAAFSSRYLEHVVWGIEKGEVSVRRVLDLLGVSLAALRTLCQSHNVPLNVGL
jgi:Zn-dependent peptidase ImmA (M78 family)/DNA-binding XRE family transcriptional regulator